MCELWLPYWILEERIERQAMIMLYRTLSVMEWIDSNWWVNTDTLEQASNSYLHSSPPLDWRSQVGPQYMCAKWLLSFLSKTLWGLTINTFKEVMLGNYCLAYWLYGGIGGTNLCKTDLLVFEFRFAHMQLPHTEKKCFPQRIWFERDRLKIHLLYKASLCIFIWECSLESEK